MSDLEARLDSLEAQVSEILMFVRELREREVSQHRYDELKKRERELHNRRLALADSPLAGSVESKDSHVLAWLREWESTIEAQTETVMELLELKSKHPWLESPR